MVHIYIHNVYVQSSFNVTWVQPWYRSHSVTLNLNVFKTKGGEKRLKNNDIKKIFF